jgi:hypothetical protein
LHRKSLCRIIFYHGGAAGHFFLGNIIEALWLRNRKR